MNENPGANILPHESTHVILISHDSSKARLGWVSQSTGFTYCGICLRSSVKSEAGSYCPACGARVAYVFDFASTPAAMRHAWKEISLGRSGETSASMTDRSYAGARTTDFGTSVASELVAAGSASS